MIIPGKYKHYKWKKYEVIWVARHTETNEVLVVYINLYEHPDYPYGSLWTRPLSMFEEDIEVDGKKIKRFEFINE